MKNIFIEKKLIFRLTFNRGLALTGFQTNSGLGVLRVALLPFLSLPGLESSKSFDYMTASHTTWISLNQ